MVREVNEGGLMVGIAESRSMGRVRGSRLQRDDCRL